MTHRIIEGDIEGNTKRTIVGPLTNWQFNLFEMDGKEFFQVLDAEKEAIGISLPVELFPDINYVDKKFIDAFAIGIWTIQESEKAMALHYAVRESMGIKQ